MSTYYRTILAGGWTFYTMKAFPETNGSTPPTGAPTGGYPVGVFNVNNTFLGFANNQSQYLTLWNADATNATYGVLEAGSTPLTFKSTSGTIPNVRGCRYWQVDVRGWANLCTGRNDRILVDNTITSATSYTRLWTGYSHFGRTTDLVETLYYAPGSYGGSPPTVPAINTWVNLYGLYDGEAKQVNINIGSTQKTVTVFHTEKSIGAGFVSNVNSSDSSGMSNATGTSRVSETLNLRGTFPPGLQHLVLFPNGIVRENCHPSNITNISELTTVVQVDCGMNDFAARTYTPVGPWNLNEYNVGSEWLSVLPRKDLLLSVSNNNYRLLTPTSSLDGTGISMGDFPNLKSIKFTYKSKPFTPNAATFPKINQYFSLIYNNFYGNEAYTAAEIDAIYNMLGTRLVGITATGDARLDVQTFNTNATAASLAARTYLAGQGWIVN